MDSLLLFLCAHILPFTLQRNYRWFLTFVFSTTLLCVWVFALSLVQVRTHPYCMSVHCSVPMNKIIFFNVRLYLCSPELAAPCVLADVGFIAAHAAAEVLR